MLRIASRLAALSLAAAFAGCSIHPLPDDVSPYTTDQIVFNVRCEAKAAVRNRIQQALAVHPPIARIDPEEVLVPANFQRIKRTAPALAGKIENYMGSSIAYDFEFLIVEKNIAGASAGFLMPFTSGGSLALAGGGNASKTRDAARRFKMVEFFQDLVKLDCTRFVQPSKNPVHPMTGSIGMGRIMDTFIDLTELGGGQGTFTDTITFVTRFDANASAGLVLLPVKDHLRLVKADAAIAAERTDTHKLIVSLAFPTQDLRVARVDRRGDSKARAEEDLCIARAEEREDRAGTLRLYPPEYYCRLRGRGAGP